MTPTPRRTIQPNGFLEGHGLTRSMRATQASRRLAKLVSPAPAPAYVAAVADAGSLGYHIAFLDIPVAGPMRIASAISSPGRARRERFPKSKTTDATVEPWTEATNA